MQWQIALQSDSKLCSKTVTIVCKSMLDNIFLHASIVHFRYESQQAKIFVSQLKCDPYDDPPFGDRLDDIDSKLKKLKTGTVWFDASR